MSSQQPDLFGRLFKSCLESLGLMDSQTSASGETAPVANPNPPQANVSEIYAWAKAENIQLNAIHDFTARGINDIYFFYQTIQDFEHYNQDGTSERLKQRFIEAARSAGISEQVIGQWKFEFGSWEEIERDYGGYHQYFN